MAPPPKRRSRRSPGPADLGRSSAWALTLAFSSLFLAVPLAFLLILGSGGGREGTDATASEARASEVRRGRDEQRHVSFRLAGRRLTMTVAGEGDRTRRRLRGKRVRLACGHDARRGSGLYERVLRWSRGGRRKSLRLPADVAAGVEFCAIERGGRTLARAVFSG